MVFSYITMGLVLGMVVIGLYRHFSRSGKNNQDFLLLNQRFDHLAQNLRQSSESTNKALRETIQLVSGQLKENREVVERSTTAVHQQVQGFTKGITALHENMKQMHESMKSVASFQNIFKSPKLRGQWGETSLEAALGQYFPRELYKTQYMFKSGEAVDAILRLPHERLLPIDAKFPIENFERMTREKDEEGQNAYRKAFLVDVRKEIDSIAAKYILPHEGTIDMALMYIPAESIYYEMVNSMREVDIASYARSKRVILVSPNTFYLTLSAIQHWYRDVHITKQTKEILKKLSRISIDGRKLSEDFRKVGKHLSDTRSAYDSSERRLGLMLGRVEGVMEIGEEKKPQLSNDGTPLEEA